MVILHGIAFRTEVMPCTMYVYLTNPGRILDEYSEELAPSRTSQGNLLPLSNTSWGPKLAFKRSCMLGVGRDSAAPRKQKQRILNVREIFKKQEEQNWSFKLSCYSLLLCWLRLLLTLPHRLTISACSLLHYWLFIHALHWQPVFALSLLCLISPLALTSFPLLLQLKMVSLAHKSSYSLFLHLSDCLPSSRDWYLEQNPNAP